MGWAWDKDAGYPQPKPDLDTHPIPAEVRAHPAYQLVIANMRARIIARLLAEPAERPERDESTAA